MRRVGRGAPSRGLRRVATAGVASVALAVTTVSSGGAFADEADGGARDLGEAADYGVVAPDGGTKFQDGSIEGLKAQPSAYFVQLAATPVIQGGSAATVTSQTDAFLAHAASVGADLEVRETYESVWSGLSVSGSRADVELAAGSEDVVAVFPVHQIEAPEVKLDPETSPQMLYAKGMTGVNEAHEMGYTGEGMRISIIDTGVDIDHPDFGGSGTPGDGITEDWKTEQVQFGYDLVGDDYDASTPETDYPVPDVNPDDCQGHGSHVAGIAAGNGDEEAGGVEGVAPDAVIGAYRVFGCEGSTNADIMLSAMELSYEDGMDVVNMSIGSGWASWPQYPTAVAADSLVDAGVVVAASIGNEGASGTFSAGAPGVSEKSIGVASYDNAMVTQNAFTYGADAVSVGYAPATGAPEPPTEGSETLVRLGDPGSVEGMACTADGGISEDLTGTMVLVDRGVCPFHEKAANAQEAGAVGVVLANNVPGVINATVEGDPAITIPVVSIQQGAGNDLNAAIAANGDEVELTWTDEVTSVESPTAGLISSFSSYGMTAELELKPDIGAPGGNIFSAYPLEKGGYASLGGTSMSSPHVAGTAALLLQARPNLKTEDVRTVLQNSADPAMWFGDPSLGILEPVHRQGAGMVDIDDAITAGAMVSPGKISLGETDAGPVTQSVQVRNTSDEPVTYALVNNTATIATDGPDYTPGYWTAATTVDAPETVTVAAGSTTSVEVTFTGPTLEEEMTVGLQYGGYLEFEPTGDTAGDVLRVPYAGYAGDYQAREVLLPGPYDDFDLPVLGVSTDGAGNYDVFPDTGNGDEPIFSLVDYDDPAILAEFGHQARSVEVTAFKANDDGTQGEEVGVVYTEDYLRRSEAPGDFLSFTWDGTFQGATVEDGKYLLEMTITKAQSFNDEGEAGTEAWTGQPFTIKDAQEAPTSPIVSRVDGTDRYSTAAKISGANYDPGVETVYIATGLTYPDALAGAARAGAEGVPVLLVKPDAIPAATRFELERLDAGNVVLFGGPVAISNEVLFELDGLTDGGVRRVAGDDRYGTAAAISSNIEPGIDTVYVATGEEFADALTGAARAGTDESAVLLTKADRLPHVTAAELERLDPTNIVILGGTEAISPEVADALAAYGEVERTAGDNRYETAAEIAAEFPAGLDDVFVATGLDYPDALTGAALAGHLNSPVLLVQQDHIPHATMGELTRLGAEEIQILGGRVAISQGVEDDLGEIVYTP
ncbi:S8 family serine peptidase [Ornithinimicrobium faecis]|uniref:S8 family serine peptidase n=1 Tax=Ornithinimicrobium faecis TaxID=2934158 RepID=A0ABY4YSA3_9MICO|nr:S8 family serine peptidase [Ornithinimicrobium sp. HY1793]USQ79474.1 S8 family serine peptidase [Ornithinimicrobium sp. HY1793]